ncbi:MAG: response regulator [Ignavibacteriae bacterium]|nr:response regulator [Ignavibacteriota bacterium]
MAEQYQENASEGNETILLVEDEEMLRDLVQSMLQMKGYRVLTASDGLAAIETFKSLKDEIALVLTDLGLPKLGGWEACRQMLQIKPQLRVVVATGYLDPTEKQAMADGGVSEFVPKPYLAEELTSTIRMLLDKGKANSTSTNLTPQS